MFIAMYEWKIKPEMEEQFCKAWAERTREIMRDNGGLGSRLHKNEDGNYIAYAQWPSREVWENATAEDTEARKIVKEATLSFQTLLRLELIDDLFV